MAAASKVVLLLGLLSACAATPATRATPDRLTVDPAPLESAQPKLLALMKDRVTVIDLWATWCEPCVKALGKFNRLSKAYGAKGLVVVGVSIGEEETEVRRFLQQQEVEYPLYLDPEFQFADSMATRSVPTLFIFDKKGRLARATTRLDASALQLIDALLLKTPESAAP